MRAVLAAAVLAAMAAPSFPVVPGGKDLTVLVYKNAKNNLEPFGFLDMNEMELAGSSDRVNVVVEFGRLPGGGAGKENWSGARRYYITKDADPAAIVSPVLWERASVDMGDWRELADFAAWGKANFPAKKYVLVIWNHGNGWKRSAGGKKARGISFDDETGNYITTPQLALALKAAGPVDVLAFDACLMQTAEVASEVRNYAQIVAGSEETEPGEGYPYDLIISGLNADPLMTAEEMGVLIARSYRARNEELYMDTTQSAVRTRALPGLLSRIDSWVAAAAVSGEPMAVKAALLSAHGFYEIDQKDLGDFFRLVELKASGRALKAASREVYEWLEKEVVAANGVSGYQHRPARGLAVYASPAYSYNEDYSGLAWAEDGLWDDLLRGGIAIQQGAVE